MLDKIVYTLLVIGGLNWALVGFFDYNLVSKVFSTDVARFIYSVVGIAALWGLVSIVRMKSKSK
jgi:hypothetical protein